VKQNGSLCIFYTASFTSYVDSTLLADGDYQILPESEVKISEDPGNVIGDLTEVPNPSSEEFVNVSDSRLPSEGKPRI
jgi:hypothetical protein